MATSKKINVTAKINRQTKKAIYLDVTTADGTISLWFQKRCVKDNEDGTFTISENVYVKAVAQKEAWLENNERENNSTVVIPAGEWGNCKNGSYYLKTWAEWHNMECTTRGDLAFVRKATVFDGELYVPYKVYMDAMEDAEISCYQTHHTDVTCSVHGIRIITEM